MKCIEFGNDTLSKLSLGTVQFGLDYGIANTSGQPEQDDVNEIINYVSKKGINCFDTAQAYGNSEQVLGIALENIENKFVISKLKSDLFREDAFANTLHSINNLSVKSLFALLLHDSKLLYDWTSEDSKKVDKLINNGNIKYFGVSIYTSEDFDMAIKNDKIKFIQIPFNLFDQRAYKERWFEKAKKYNKLIFIRSVFLQGLLLMDKDKVPFNLEPAKKYIDILESFANDLQITRNELALSFVDSIATDSLILFGCDNLSQAKENITNYNSLKELEQSTITKILGKLSDLDEKIYNPTKW
jgi:aryl-alcohol dehydrogenase-like predicted oxidoreductase